MEKDIELRTENTKAQMRKGILEFAVLLVVSKEAVYASDILKELKENDLLVVEGTLYPLLSRLKRQGMLEYSWQESSAGPPRKYYQLTDSGKEMLKELEREWEKLVSSINQIIKNYE